MTDENEIFSKKHGVKNVWKDICSQHKKGKSIDEDDTKKLYFASGNQYVVPFVDVRMSKSECLTYMKNLKVYRDNEDKLFNEHFGEWVLFHNEKQVIIVKNQEDGWLEILENYPKESKLGVIGRIGCNYFTPIGM